MLDRDDERMIEDKIDSAQRLTEQALDELRYDMRRGGRSRQDMAAAFNRVAETLEKLVTEVQGLRRDLTPELDKTKTLPAPKAQEGP